ncbi:MAG: YaiO family outer membrane beta-barrel protein [Nitrospira sp.]|nr:YaiO family outer membrane beta-barrel protein [Nitrospira sp.]
MLVRRLKRSDFLFLVIPVWFTLSGVTSAGSQPLTPSAPASPSTTASLVERAKQLETAERYQEAIAVYRQILVIDPENDDVRASLARLLSWQGSSTEAIELYRVILQRHPDDLDIQTSLARVLSWQRSTEESRALYQAVLSKDPQHVEALEGLGNLFYWEGRLEEALSHYEQAYALSNSPTLAERVALIKRQQSTGTQAQRAIASSPQAPLGSRDSTVQLPFRDYVRIGYGQFSYTRNIPNEHNVVIEAAKSVGDQTLVGRVESLHRFGLHDVPFSAELYSPLWQRAWGYVGAQGTVNAEFTPVYSVGGEVYQGLGIIHSALSIFEASMGYRRLSYKTDDIDLVMPSFTIYLPFDTWITEQLYWVPKTGALTLASRLTWRPTPRIQFFASGSFGTTGERIIATQDLTRIQSHAIQGGAIVPVAERISLEATGFYEDRGFLYSRQGGLFSLIYHW